MADLVKIKGGNGTTPQLQDREIAYNKTEKALYIGTENGNVRLCGADDIQTLTDRLTALEERLKTLETPSE